MKKLLLLFGGYWPIVAMTENLKGLFPARMKFCPFLILILVFFLPERLYATDFEYEGIKYTIIDETARTCKTKSGNEVSGALVLPKHPIFGGEYYSLTEIGAYSFNGSNQLTSVTIPNSVVTIGYYAFFKCESLDQITIPGSVRFIEQAFGNCSNLKEINFQNGETTLNFVHHKYNMDDLTYMFSDCPLEKVYIGRNIEYYCPSSYNGSIDTPFYYNRKITEVTFGNLVTEIPENLFDQSLSLETVNFSSSIKTIGKRAFRGCQSLKNIVLPSELNNIEEYVFYGCNSLNNVILPNTLSSIQKSAFGGCKSLTDIIFPNTLNAIGEYAFSGCLFDKITLPPTISFIGEGAFQGQTNLTEVYYGTQKPVTNGNYFDNKVYEDATLYMPEPVLENINSFYPWKRFIKRVAWDPSIVNCTSIELNITEWTGKVGDSIKLNTIIKPDNTTDITVIWTSSNESVAKVDDLGNVTAVSIGNATITATCGSVSATCLVTVEPIPTVLCSSLTLNHSKVTLYFGQGIVLNATVLPENATNREIEWTSSNPNIATVDSKGFVSNSAIESGEVIITARTTDGSNLEATCKVNIIPKPVTSVDLSITSWSGYVGDKISITAIVNPKDADFGAINWEIEGDSNVLTFDFDSDLGGNYIQSTAKLTAKSVGRVTVWASAGYPQVRSGCVVEVKPRLAESITLSHDAAKFKIGESLQLMATVLPENTTNKTVTWTSSNENVATVDANGKVTAVALGNAVITASCGSISAICAVTVEPTPVESLTLAATTWSGKVGEIIALTATVSPENATDKSVSWSSSDENVATVDANGNVTAISLGNATITATCGSVSATCSVTVVPTPVESLTLSKTTWSGKVSERIALTATVSPENATDNSVTWRSSD
ncbi:MAG: Ig-like domain-containing protein, partial [Muribaculaceae bacterium]|nr:Ig-like domain-containing protein [Muribaculaceae bacterium]